ncbi:hypothetical protein EWG10_19760 [Salmonella enterica subsp. enterica serovar Napoli]|uniref:Secreted protein n=1 Tax=Podoviridae sp. cti6G1 TaxID=2826570 RepID=A0A8S5LUQ4_9CAUD|nr:hypothetical protein [Salmonella enterica subsp. enterica serovar Napoli]EEK4623784.1 hypothetical protein [Salmonella enterica]DAD73616.1 MAG TPA: hypothetical protein [Podoviridae sp. cti6G1]ECB3570546.1 hypothetical protein [Salmonella enterica subsp. enterica serovar Napoli]EGB1266217.1 hypothetical protein [Salmonella enterica]
MKTSLFILGLLFAGASNAQTIALQCGGFRFDIIENSMSKINGEFVTSQKISEFGQNGMKMDMALMPARDGNMYGFEYVHPDGSKKHWLNVELIRGNMNEPRIIGTFDCKRVSG